MKKVNRNEAEDYDLTRIIKKLRPWFSFMDTSSNIGMCNIPTNTVRM